MRESERKDGSYAMVPGIDLAKKAIQLLESINENLERIAKALEE